MTGRKEKGNREHTSDTEGCSCSIEDIRHTLDKLVKKIDTKDKKLDELIVKVGDLERVVAKRDEKIKTLEQKVKQLEDFTNESKRYSLKNNVIIRGLAIKKPERTFAQVAGADKPMSASESSEAGAKSDQPESRPKTKPEPSNHMMFQCVREQVLQYIDNKMGLKLEVDDVVAAHELKQGKFDTVPPLVVRFGYTSVKQDVMQSFRNHKLYQQKVYFNDQLTVVNGKIAYAARALVKSKTIHSTYTQLGKVFIKISERDRPKWIQSLEELPS